MRLKNKVAVVTGASRGIGKDIALAFAQEGAQVICVSRSIEEESLTDIKKISPQAIGIPCDISNTEQVKKLFEMIDKKYGGLDILVNNAGVAGRSLGDGPAHQCSEEAWDLIMGINLKGTYLCTKYALRIMLKHGIKGNIINMSSVLGLVGCQEHFISHAYQTTKAAIIGFTRSVAAYYAKYGIRANTLAPGLIKSDSTEKVYINSEIMEFVKKMQPLGTEISAQQVAEAAVFLASDNTQYITGQVLTIDSGWSMQ